MKTDQQLKSDVSAELAWDPTVNATRIGVAVKNGVVTLGGEVETYLEKHAVERAVRRVAGVRGIALDLVVSLAPGHQRTDTEIAEAALRALAWHALVPDGKVKVAVEDGWVTLTGEVDWGYQSSSAEKCIRPLLGVRGVTNQIRLQRRVNPADIQADISAALSRHARREAKHLEIGVDDGIVTLTGRVDSIAERDAVLGTVMASRGVIRVIDRLDIVD